MFQALSLFLLITLVYRLWRVIVSDYRFWLSLGPGGIPSTPYGYFRSVLLRFIARRNNLELPEPLHSSSPFRAYFRPGTTHATLPPRHAEASGRPRVAGIVPQRQITQQGTQADIARLQATMTNFVNANPSAVQTGTSCYEKHSPALFLSSIALGEKTKGVESETRSRLTEIAHTHGTEGSLHVTLHPEDVATVISAGWGERHPLAGRTLPDGYIMVYAPRGDKELRVVMDIVKAGAWWKGNMELEG